MNRTIYLYSKNNFTIEYSVAGEGTPILVFHGGHSNCREAFGYDELLKNGYAVITPSRVGYGKSRAEDDSLKSAGAAYADLLDHLQIEKVHVIAISAGGASGIYFAAHYPERVKTLTLQSAVSKEWLTEEDGAYKAAKILFRPSTEKYTWMLMRFLSNLFPKFIFKQMVSSFSSLPFSKVRDYMRQNDIEKFTDMMNRQRSGNGFMIDLRQTSSIAISDLQAIQCPTIIIHSKHDSAVSIDHAYHAHESISNSKLCVLDTWGHLIWLGKGSEKLHDVMLDFLHDNC